MHHLEQVHELEPKVKSQSLDNGKFEKLHII